ncbi:hypothetical protein SanaruYs_35170 [Chryseotalea sanaruensis]|uniref:Uncharacterized protein n=1 Tax=Chryseotalea sanaruensis TaxID=2482724 RepID=A0A401UEJ5_9BACT|nr:hypothetical protein [Chryseotalea sanaruensis]GCC53274.1 hypothetical protein SanaruYs_35170 [Chryseotalea sanaruensis]
MKTLIIILLFSASIIQAQTLVLSTGVEKTVANTESQFMMGYQSKKQRSIGTFYQNNVNRFISENNPKQSYWYGVFTALPIAKSEKISVYAMLRAGLMDEQFVVIVPSLETKIKVSKWLAVGVASSYRQGYPAFSFKTQFSLFNQSTL